MSEQEREILFWLQWLPELLPIYEVGGTILAVGAIVWLVKIIRWARSVR